MFGERSTAHLPRILTEILKEEHLSSDRTDLLKHIHSRYYYQEQLSEGIYINKAKFVNYIFKYTITLTSVSFIGMHVVVDIQNNQNAKVLHSKLQKIMLKLRNKVNYRLFQ